MPKGTEITAHINGNTDLDTANFRLKPGEGQQTAATPLVSPQTTSPLPPAASDNLATVVVKSTPPGADVTVNGKFIGSTPSRLRLAPGHHIISITKPGFKNWQRTMMVSPGGMITIDVTLERPI